MIITSRGKANDICPFILFCFIFYIHTLSILEIYTDEIEYSFFMKLSLDKIFRQFKWYIVTKRLKFH